MNVVPPSILGVFLDGLCCDHVDGARSVVIRSPVL